MARAREWGAASGVVPGVVLGILMLAGAAAPQGLQAELRDPAGQVADDFGRGLAADGDRVAVGAPQVGFGNVTQVGVVNVYRRVEADGAADWVLEQRIEPPRLEASQFFGHGVDLQGDRLAVGAPGTLGIGGAFDGDPGSVHVYEWDGEAWELDASLTVPAVPPSERLGTRVVLDGERLAALAGPTGVPVTQHGIVPDTVHVFRREAGGWVHEARLEDPLHDETFFTSLFGESLLLAGDLLAVGVPVDPTFDPPNSGLFFTGAGAVHLYRQVEAGDGDASWVPDGKLRAAGLAQYGRFGSGLAMVGDALAVGAFTFRPDPDGPKTGAVHLFERDGPDGEWSHADVLAPLSSALSGFGDAVAAHDGRLLVGAAHDATLQVEEENDPQEAGSAEVHVPVGAGWALEQRLTPPKPDAFPYQVIGPNGVTLRQRFGVRVALSETVAAVTQLSPTSGGVAGAEAGVVWLFDPALPAGPPAWASVGGLSAGDRAATLHGEGEPLAGAEVAVVLEGAGASATVLVVAGAGLQHAPNHPEGIGVPALGSLLFPSADLLFAGLVADVGGGLRLEGAWPAAAPTGLEVYLQAIVEDAGAPGGAAFTNTLRGTTLRPTPSAP